MLIFAITTTTRLAGLSLYEKDKLLGEIHVEMAKTHSTTILEQIDSLLKWTGKKLDEIENVIVSIGPGSFTGVRIAISVVKGLFFGRNVNFYEVNELDALVFQGYYNLKTSLENDEDVKIYSMIDSRKEKIYCAGYETLSENKLKLVKNYEVAKLENVIDEIIENKGNNKKVYLIGDAVFNYKAKILDKLGNCVKIFEDKNLTINTMTFVQMFFDKNLENRYEFYKNESQNNIKAFINIGGNLLSLGENADIINNQKILLDESSPLKTGLVGKFLKDDIPVFYLLNIKSIALYYNLEYDPDKFSKIGTSSIYYDSSKNFWNYIIVAIFCLFILAHLIFFRLKKNKFIEISS